MRCSSCPTTNCERAYGGPAAPGFVYYTYNKDNRAAILHHVTCNLRESY